MSNRPRALLLAVLAAACAACSTTALPAVPAPPPDPSTASAPEPVGGAGSPDGLRDLLRSSWAGDRHRGFFVEAPTPARAVSLYATRWWLETRTAAGHPAAEGLDTAAVHDWVAPIAEGRPSGDGDVSGLPPLERIDDAVGVLAAIGRPAQPGAVAAALATLQEGDDYRSGPGGAADAGDTVIALDVFATIGVAPPAQVTAAVRQRADRATTDRRPEDLLAFTVPELAALPDATVTARRDDLSAELQWISTQLPQLPPLARISVTSTVAPLLHRLGMASWPASAVCPGLVVSAAGAAASAAAEADPQLTAEAAAAGCLTAPEIPPWTTAGWPNGDALDSALPASVDGARVAAAAGASGTYRAALREQLTQVWAPALAAHPSAAMAVAADLLAGQLGVPAPAQPSEQQISTALAGPGSDDQLTEELEVLVTRPGGPSAAGPRSRGGPAEPSVAGPASSSASFPGSSAATTSVPTPAASAAPLKAAIEQEVRARITSDPAQHAAAVRTIAGLRSSGVGLFAVEPAGSPSLSATVFASWILGLPFPAEALAAAGVCHGFTCTGDDPGAAPPPLQTAAAAQALTVPATDVFPFSY